jgi:ribose transport system substrate-binding protein
MNNDVDVVVAFNPEILESVAQAKKDLISLNKEKIDVGIYGTGSTSKIISLLEDKVINATAMQNEFNIGYLGVKTAMRVIKGEQVDNGAISSTVINTGNMYSEENQRLLFPLIR